jgi:hypothetical protein
MLYSSQEVTKLSERGSEKSADRRGGGGAGESVGVGSKSVNV